MNPSSNKSNDVEPFQWRRFAIIYLYAQSIMAASWWLVMLTVPELRRFFTVKGAPDSVLFAFLLPDALLYIGAAMMAATDLIGKRTRGLFWLTIHAGAAGYAALYSCMLTILSGGQAIASALFMIPSLFMPLVLLWKLKCGDRLK